MQTLITPWRQANITRQRPGFPSPDCFSCAAARPPEVPTDFMTVLAHVRLIAEDPRQARERLRALFAREEDSFAGNR
jgi:hypothetical protein